MPKFTVIRASKHSNNFPKREDIPATKAGKGIYVISIKGHSRGNKTVNPHHKNVHPPSDQIESPKEKKEKS